MARVDVYEAIGLTRNPFVVEPVPGVDPHLWIDRGHSAAPDPSRSQFVQIIGPKGVGKTSHLLWWRRQAPGPYRHLPPGWRRLRPLPLGNVVYWDEADRAPRATLAWALRRAAWQGSTVVAGTHVDLGPAARRAGLAVVTVELAPLTAADVSEFASLRIAASARDGSSRLVLTEADAASVAAEARWSWHRAADLLHVWAAELAGGRRWTSSPWDPPSGR